MAREGKFFHTFHVSFKVKRLHYYKNPWSCFTYLTSFLERWFVSHRGRNMMCRTEILCFWSRSAYAQLWILTVACTVNWYESTATLGIDAQRPSGWEFQVHTLCLALRHSLHQYHFYLLQTFGFFIGLCWWIFNTPFQEEKTKQTQTKSHICRVCSSMLQITQANFISPTQMDEN